MEYRKKKHIQQLLCGVVIGLSGHTSLFAAGKLIATDDKKITNKQKPSTQVKDIDPFEIYNRPVFEFNNAVDKVFLRPLSVVYADFIPEVITTRVSSFFDLWEYPIDSVAYAVQGKWNNSKEALLKFSVSFILTAGTSDAGEYVGVQDYKPTSINATVAHFGIEQGPYLVLPFLGHGSSRKVLSGISETASSPLRMHNEYKKIQILKIVKNRAKYINADETLENTSLDFYAAIRDITLQNEKSRIGGNSKTPSDLNSYEFDDSDEDLGL